MKAKKKQPVNAGLHTVNTVAQMNHEDLLEEEDLLELEEYEEEYEDEDDDDSDFEMFSKLLKDEIINYKSSKKKPGYHLAKIPKGVLGELSKIEEELAEAKDAEAQGVKLMLLVELSDMLGAIEAYLRVQFPTLSMVDLYKMSKVTQRAFRNGSRK